MDDATVYELTNFKIPSVIQKAADEVVLWSQNNNMELNPSKCKEMIISFSNECCDKLPPIKLDEMEIERIDSIKVLGVHLNNKMNWKDHINFIYKKASQRTYNIIVLKRSGLKAADLVRMYCAIIRSVLEYASPVWGSGITQEQAELLEIVQKRVLKIIYPKKDYIEALETSGLQSLTARRHKLAKIFFNKVCSPDDKVHKLLDLNIENNYNFRNYQKFNLPICRTDRFKNTFIPYSVFNFQ